jgi:N-acetylmuramoyl-L-alanine amidase
MMLPLAGASAQQAPSQPPTAAAKSRAKAAAHAPAATHTKFIVGLGGRIDDRDVEIWSLSNPHRLLIDLPQMGVSLPSRPPPNSPAGVVKSFQYMSPAPGKMRIVIDVTGPVTSKKTIDRSPNGKGDRLVVDIFDARAAPALQPPAPRLAVSPPKPTIVIDPGHGGHDSGARKYGTVEKDVVLSFSLKLREKLAETGFYKVLMTRKTDEFIPLEERRRFAERHQAALFIAIHADYTQRASARGATIYSLRPHVAEMLRRAAEDSTGELGLSGKQLALVTEAGADIAEVGAVRRILAEKARDLIERNSLRTSVLARSIINYVGSSTNLMENPDRNAAFVVLKTAKVPAILLELGYVTNQEDAAQLKSDKWRDRVASAMVTAINTYVRDCLLMTQC